MFLHVSTQPVPPPVKIVPGSVHPPHPPRHPLSSSASDGSGQKQYLDMAADVPQTSPGRTGWDSEGNFWLGTTPRRGVVGRVWRGEGDGFEEGGLQTMWFMRTLEGEHEDYLDSAGRLIYGEVPL